MRKLLLAGLLITTPAWADQPLPPEELDALRGGFSLPGGMEVRFGFDMTTSVGGIPVQQFTLAPSSLAELSGMGGLPARADVILNGGATRIETQLGNGVGTMIQNRMDGARIQRSTVIDIDIAGMRGMLGRGAVQSMTDTALGVRQRFGR
jgi:hypothetical protein